MNTFKLHFTTASFRHEKGTIMCRIPMNLWDPANSVSHTIIDLQDRFESKRLGYNGLMTELARLMVAEVTIYYGTGKVGRVTINHSKMNINQYR
jgi:hypothetical protein